MKKSQLFKEALLATSLIITFVFALSYFPLKFEAARPIKQDFGDFDVYDMYYADRNKANTKRDTSIVLFQVGNSRTEIAEQLLRISSLEPAVIGIDVTFPPKDDSIGNEQLLSAIAQTPNVVYSYRLLLSDTVSGLHIGPSQVPDSVLIPDGGYINFLGEEYSVVRYYSPFTVIDKKEYPALTSRIIEKYSPASYNRLKERKKEIEVINFSGNMESYDHFTTEDLAQRYDQMKDIVKGKIVLIGFFSEEPLVLSDLKFTPLNHTFSGKSYPDMYGMVVHANILSMLLSGRYATLIPLWLSYILAFLFTFCLVLFMIRRYKRNPHPAHWKFFVAQFVSIILLVFIFLLFFSFFKIKVQLLPIIISQVLAVEMFGLYISVAGWLHKKIKYETIFHHS